jgi:hypothetical protein
MLQLDEHIVRTEQVDEALCRLVSLVEALAAYESGNLAVTAAR